MELYNTRCKTSKRKADLKFAIDVLLLCRPGIIKVPGEHNNVNQFGMYKSYFRIGWRNLVKNKGYAFINIGGLALGMTVAMIIGLWIYDELSFNTSHDNYERIAQVMVSGRNNSGPWVQSRTSPPFGGELRNLYGREFKHVIMASQQNNVTISFGETGVVKRGHYFEPGIADMLTLNMIHGSYSALNKKQSILLSASLAKELFGHDDPMGKVIKLENRMDVEVTGVYEDLPTNSNFSDVHWMAPWDLYTSVNDWIRKDDWRQNGFFTYVQLADHADLGVVSHQIKDIKLNNVNEEEAKAKPQLFLHPMSRWRLHSGFDGNAGRIQFIWLYGCIGGFVLILACINFMNLSTARSEKRAKEVGIRKSIGSARTQLICQFFSESLLVAAFAFLFALVIAQAVAPGFTEIAGKKIIIPWSNPYFWMWGIGFTMFTGALAGSYPALYLSSFGPTKALKGAISAGPSAILLRKALVVVQFTVSVTLIIGVMIVFRQIQVGKDQPVGYDQPGLIWANAYSGEIHDHMDAIRNELKQSGVITEMAESVNTVTNIGFRFGGYEWPDMVPGTEAAFATAWVGHEFGRTVGWQIVEGRDFSRDIASDTAAIILNEASVEFMNLKDPVGKTIKLTLFDRVTHFTIVGVVKNMLQESPYYPVQKTVYMVDNSEQGGRVVNMRIDPSQDTPTALAKIESVFKKYDPASPFVYTFAEEAFTNKFSEEERIGKLAFTFAGLAIFISCLGIFGLASFIAEQRTKEIGIRKVLGASVRNVWQLLSGDFLVLVIISSTIAIPVAYYLMHGWLEQFELRTSLSWHVFAIAGLSALIVTLITVSYQAIRAAVANPIKSLRSE